MAFLPGKIYMIQAQFNKARSATQDELDDLFSYELRHDHETSFPDFVEAGIEDAINEALIAVWETENPTCKQMVVYWSWQGITAWYQWSDAGHLELVKSHRPSPFK